MSSQKKDRRSREGGYACGDETRQRILEAALELFGEYGFAGSSTRDIAARAGVNAPALRYYFHDKAGVYRACCEALADDAWRIVGPAIERAWGALHMNVDVVALTDAFIGIQEAIASCVLASEGRYGGMFLFAPRRTQYNPDSSAQILARRVREPLIEASAGLVARISRRAAHDPVTLIRTLSLHGALAVFNVAHSPALWIPGWQDLCPEQARQLMSAVSEQTRMLLDRWSRES